MIDEINKLKKQLDAVILVHSYQRPEIYKVADYIGDSLGLSKKALETKAKVIVFCGVHFMAETAKILNPDKTVLLPVQDAGCPMADMVTAEKLRKFKARHPGKPVVCYINTTAEVKAECDICVTSGNALRIVEKMDADEIIFVPDQNLAAYVALKSSKKIIPWQGFCNVHHSMKPDQVQSSRYAKPDALMIAHPECPMDILEQADHVASTSGMLDIVRNSEKSEFLIATEVGLIERLKLEFPDKRFYSAGPAKTCINMKKNTLESVRNALKYKKHEIFVKPETANRARKCIERMIELS